MNIIYKECEFISNDKGVLVIFNEHAVGYEDLAKALSEEISMPVMVLYIYDDDEWGYFYCEDGVIKDLFSVMPHDEYEGVTPEQKGETTLQQYNGSAGFIAEQFNIDIESIINYYKIWTDKLIEDEEAAYEDDECTYGDCWQMADFMKKLGFPFPDGSGQEEISKEKSPQAATDLKKYSEPENPQKYYEQEKLNEYSEHGKSKKYPEPKKFFEYADATPYVGAFDYGYRVILLERYGSRLKDIIKLLESGQYRQASEELTKKIDCIKDNCNCDEERKFLSSLYILRGSCNRAIGNSWNSGKDLDAAYELEPENVYILRQRVQAGTSKERIKRVINDLNTLMRIDRKNYDYYLVERAWRYYRLEEMEAARKDLMEAKIRCNSNDNIDFVDLSRRLGV